MTFPKYVIGLSAAGTAVGIFVLYKDLTGPRRYEGAEKLPGRTVIVTGASSGIGKETAKELAKREARVILACRNMVKCEAVRSEIVEETFNRNVHCMKLNLASMKSIRDFADAINKNEKRVDILVNNAGTLQQDRSITEDGFETHLGVNYLGPFLLTNLLLEKLITSSPSRIINVIGIGYQRVSIGFTDFNHEKQYVADEAYKRSALAMAMFSSELSTRLEGKGVSVYGVHPGIVNTSLRDSFHMNKKVLSGGTVSKPFWYAMFLNPVQGAQTSIYCALDPSIAKESGFFYSNCRKAAIDPVVNDEQRRKRLWAISERWTQLDENASGR